MSSRDFKDALNTMYPQYSMVTNFYKYVKTKSLQYDYTKYVESNDKATFSHVYKHVPPKKSLLSLSLSSSISFRSNPSDDMFKILLIGDAECGKSSINSKFTNDQFYASYISTIGVDYRYRTLHINNQNIKLQIFDTSGVSRFRTIAQSYYPTVDAILIVFDITNKKSFNSVKYWLDDIDENNNDNNDTYKMIIGNKCDLEWKRVIDTEDGESFANECGINYMECSAKTGINIENVFTSVAECLATKNRSKTEITYIEFPQNTTKANERCVIL